MSSTINDLDNLFKSYNYVISSKSNDKVRIYTLRYGMYHAAEIVLLDDNFDASKIKAEYSELGYATEIKKLKNADIEEYLFEGFFIKTPLGNELKNRYTQFVKKQLQNLPEGSEYKYIQSSFDLLFQDPQGVIVEQKNYNGVTDIPIVNKINSLLTETRGPIFIIIEAAAGFGKTCTANEVLNVFSTQENKKLPFFTELSRNREARVFKHILLNEIDEQFPSGIKQNIVIDQITKGRIPLIIDGFDELISKDSNKEEVESMLTTIIELLKGEAKIIITSRKTAIFNSNEFLSAIYDANNSFSMARFEIKEPTVENWLNSDRMELITSSDFPIEQISNPVLLSYLRNIPIDKLENYLNNSSDGSLIDKYVEYLLNREQLRQNIKLTNETQLRIFRKLMRLMTEFNITAESKDTIKELIKDYNLKILQSSLKEYISEERPSIEDLVETLSNHVFLDRKPSGNVGIINDFIFGLLVGENLINGKYQEYYPDYAKLIPLDFAKKSLQSFKIQGKKRKEQLWEIYNSSGFDYDAEFFFHLDFIFLKKFTRQYEHLFLSEFSFSDISFSGDCTFQMTNFSNVSFHNCYFDLKRFCECSFFNCSFYDCTYEFDNNKSFKDFGVFACTSNNDFLTTLIEMFEEGSDPVLVVTEELTEINVLSHFFGKGNLKPKATKISYIKSRLSNYSVKEVSKIISLLRNKEYLYFKDDVGFISKQGIGFYNQNRIQ